MTFVPRRHSVGMFAVFAFALLVAGSSPGASAQCVGPDNLDVGPCCAPVLPTLPPFPGTTLPALGVCWNNCTPINQQQLKVDWLAPTQPFCGEYNTPLVVTDVGSGAPILAGTMVLDYTRTWLEIDPVGTVHQVWRFVAKADLTVPTPGLVPPCPVPSCIAPVGPYTTAFYYGYVDYRGCVAAGATFDNTLVLFHSCDRFIHMAGLSNRPGSFHPGRSFAIVAPHSALQPFVPGNLIAPGGALLAEATRKVNSILPAICTVEDRVASGSITPLGAACVCTLAKIPKQQSMRDFSGKTTCLNSASVPGGWASLLVNFPVLPWYHMISTSIGCWTNPGVYPGLECVWVEEGLFVHNDACNGNFVECKYGASTKGGWTVLSPLIMTSFTDLADNYTAPTTGPFPMPVVGTVQPTDHLIYVNLP